ncbi:MAG: hypothetical protein GX334_01025 [Firmicutes bacterium]|nr:hypothetical protein [Bacillota bacterium]
MDLAITLLLVIMILFWPKKGQARYYMLLILGLVLFLVVFVFAPIVLLSPLFYLGLVIIAILLFYKGVHKS